MISALYPRFAVNPPRNRPRLAPDRGTGVDADHFRSAMGALPTGVAVATVLHRGEPAGMTVGTFTSISLRPPLAGFFADRGSGTLPKIVEAGAFAVNLLDAEGDALCRAFGRPGDRRFDGVPWTPSELGSPLLDAAALWVDCRLDEVVAVGDHFLVVGRAEHLDTNPAAGNPLVFHRGTYTTTDTTTRHPGTGSAR